MTLSRPSSSSSSQTATEPPQQPCVSEILKNRVYLGNLAAALSPHHLNSIGATHILSVCLDYPPTCTTPTTSTTPWASGITKDGRQHLVIPVQDSEYEDLLIHLPRACRFIESALAGGGRVLVHCVMGVSRSATVVAAYLMKSKGMDVQSALRFIKRGRPRINPNYGFIIQLITFSACGCDPSPTNAVYRAWKKKHKQAMTVYLNYISDTTAFMGGKLLLSSSFPEDPLQADFLIHDLGATHLLSLSPSKIPRTTPSSPYLSEYRHLSFSEGNREDLLLALPDACAFIRQAIVNDGGTVLVHCLVESRASTVVCASLMDMKNVSPQDALKVLQDALPLFDPTRNFSRHLELFAACAHKPTREHYLVRDWIRSQESRPPFSSSSSPTSSVASSPGPSTPPSSYPSSRTSSASSSHAGDDGRSLPTLAQVLGAGIRKGGASWKGRGGDGGVGGIDSLAARAMELLAEHHDGDDEARFDLDAFGKALVAIQENSGTRQYGW